MRKSLSLLLIINCALLIALTSCSSTKQIGKQANQYVINDSNLTTAHVGICIYDATDNKYLYNYQSDKFFIPASNTKIITCYAAMKHLGDSLVGLRYTNRGDSLLIIYPTGDPTFLHPDFKYQPVFSFFKENYDGAFQMDFGYKTWDEEAWGVGWSWDDYNDDYMAERSAFPIYGNVVKFTKADVLTDYKKNESKAASPISVQPNYFLDSIINPIDSITPKVFILPGGPASSFSLQRFFSSNQFVVKGQSNNTFTKYIPFVTNKSETALRLLNDTLHNSRIWIGPQIISSSPRQSNLKKYTIHSQPTDSLLKIMMHRSDNFYAEQSLLMIGNEMLGVMNDEKVVDTLLKTDYKDMPQRPQWVDGSGLSRFNLFTPQDFVYVLNKMRTDYSWNRITTIFETGGTGTLNNYYKTLRGKIFAKTGSLSNNIALSGYLITPKNKTLIFSVLVNNHTAGATAVRRAVERFLTQVQAEN